MHDNNTTDIHAMDDYLKQVLESTRNVNWCMVLMLFLWTNKYYYILQCIRHSCAKCILVTRACVRVYVCACVFVCQHHISVLLNAPQCNFGEW